MEKLTPSQSLAPRKGIEEVKKEVGDKGRLVVKVVMGKNGSIENKVVRSFAKGG